MTQKQQELVTSIMAGEKHVMIFAVAQPVFDQMAEIIKELETERQRLVAEIEKTNRGMRILNGWKD